MPGLPVVVEEMFAEEEFGGTLAKAVFDVSARVGGVLGLGCSGEGKQREPLKEFCSVYVGRKELEFWYLGGGREERGLLRWINGGFDPCCHDERDDI